MHLKFYIFFTVNVALLVLGSAWVQMDQPLDKLSAPESGLALLSKHGARGPAQQKAGVAVKSVTAPGKGRQKGVNSEEGLIIEAVKNPLQMPAPAQTSTDKKLASYEQPQQAQKSGDSGPKNLVIERLPAD